MDSEDEYEDEDDDDDAEEERCIAKTAQMTRRKQARTITTVTLTRTRADPNRRGQKHWNRESALKSAVENTHPTLPLQKKSELDKTRKQRSPPGWLCYHRY